MAEKIYDEINLQIAKANIKGKRILDIGCGSGMLGEVLRRKGNYVIGVNISPSELEIARNRLDEVIYHDVTSITDVNLEQKVDVLLLSDILEHTPDPVFVLKKFLKYLKSDGLIIISIPNVACYNMRLRLLFGFFNYEDYGILDKTHLRFFTKRSLLEFLKNCGLTVVKMKVSPYFVRPLFKILRSVKLKFKKGKSVSDFNQNVFNSPVFKIYAKYIFPMENILPQIYPSLFAYQFIVFCKFNKI